MLFDRFTDMEKIMCRMTYNLLRYNFRMNIEAVSREDNCHMEWIFQTVTTGKKKTLSPACENYYHDALNHYSLASVFPKRFNILFWLTLDDIPEFRKHSWAPLG